MTFMASSLATKNFLDWSDDYATGIEAIDNDHRRLFDAVNALHHSYAMYGEDADFGDLLDVLSVYVDRHFAREEELMLGLGYPDFESHRIGHQELATTVHEYAKLHRTNPGGISRKEMLSFLGNWLTGHILGSDMDYVPYIK